MKITHVTTRALRTPADNTLVVGLPAPTDTREFVTLELGTDQGLVGIGLTFFGGALTPALRAGVDSLGHPAVGEGPTGLALDEGAERLYVLNKFEASISVVDTASELETARVFFHDPTPALVTTGRKHLYDTHKNSGLGQIACASCHVDARIDRLAWDLGDPAGALKSLTGQNLGAHVPGSGWVWCAFTILYAMFGVDACRPQPTEATVSTAPPAAAPPA